ncbi:phenylalanyl-tRNA synthetase beta chain [Clostridium acetobutylicum]|uniref:Phenylalanine--tRNA ligase beta subunit n=1 Tax=Clostridium acetobutylicum (strain ATCC 824 / DSM 792 / JCM 1419 / IAM 19013 / LMG 5710 / NBRC 13948 / NRRL B-527 / VKM B-1787 / 2291 / W) TaxID=272562 RepID=SYFB_CLOAB|nr:MULTISPECIES: phenylalanine--tRNA ligase subunit beta [Clostridium]Q97GL0.1 RecName: Full=Phenylalanine--tRNA ligase beta subunit; AltName: Full=Phenylalanyl-tRNA synthetase beta subunit; Short=PheRS [Clostridium acetobutylicum ATCC 824]AAK80312.1 Phenylalanyl-tRNA synthetase (beta subunit) [Clostridium acetobutylicum ATCC 824]ADZ21407.1 phenylalanyl-tRNA synthetase subunit beta [Clostridium acetobutylicum EA 2018]AEI34183.1 phenylalanyl-tRNA synthetase subunit beta [Clostridium acetobutylic
MKVPVKWLKDYVDFDINAKELGDRLTLSGSKVEEIITSGDEITNVVTGKILKIDPHPDAEKLVICSVDVGKNEPIQIVTGAQNMKENDIVPVALHGSTLPGGVKIKKGKLRGVVSNGMMCAKEELGIADEEHVHGLMILDENTPIGKDIKEVLGLDNPVIDFEITSNRPDCLSVIGIARETAATINTKYRNVKIDFSETKGRNIKEELEVEVKDKLCRRYMARVIKNVKIEDSPAWMQERLMLAGVRPINNIVDITNFVMLEVGQPMHAFDKKMITSNKIVIERAKDGEKFTTLDSEERSLDSNVLMIKDGDKNCAIAGIMGGLDSEVAENTHEIIFESANFDGTNIRVSSQKLALRTEASGRYEKDLDPNLAEIALNRACTLIQELNAGEIVEGVIDIYPVKSEPNIVEVDYNWINNFLGIKISKEEMKEYLDRLELTTEIKGDKLEVFSPTFRCDINIKEDVAEEVARIYGYNKVPSTTVKSQSIRTGKSKIQQIKDVVTDILISSGLNESINYSFVSPKIFDKILVPEDSELRNVVKIRNPLGEDFSVMRTTTLHSMMESLARNYSHNNELAKLFEIGKVYIPSENEGEIPKERNVITIGMYGNVDYFDLKGVVENLVEILGVNKISYARESENPTFHPGKTAVIKIKNTVLGTLGEVHPDVCENYEVEERCYVAEIDLDLLLENVSLSRKYKALPKFPTVTRDISVLVDEDILVQEIENVIKRQGGTILESLNLFDVYKGKQVPQGKKSVSYALTYRDENKTLTDKDVEKIQNKVIKTLEHVLGAELR